MSECGFPATEHEWNYINGNVAALVKKEINSAIHFAGWIRAIKEDVSISENPSQINHLNLSAVASDIMIDGKYGGRKTATVCLMI